MDRKRLDSKIEIAQFLKLAFRRISMHQSRELKVKDIPVTNSYFFLSN